MPVVGVLVEAVVGHQHELVADLVAQVAQRDLHDAVGARRRPTPSASFAARDAEEDHRGHAEVGERPHLLAEALLRVLHDARHRDDRLGRVDALLHEQRRDEVVDRHACLGHEPAQRRGATQAPHPPLGKGHSRRFYRCEERHEGVDQTVDGVRVGLDVDVQASARARSPT